MEVKIYNLLRKFSLLINQKSDFEIFSLNSKIYNEFFQKIPTKNLKNVIFFRKRHDCIDYYAIIDELIKNNTNILIAQENFHGLSYSKVNSVTDFDSIEDGIYSYPKINLKNLLDIDMIVYPLQLVKNNYGYIYNKFEYEFLKKFKGIKIGIGYNESNLKSKFSLKDFNFIKFDKILLV